MRTLMAMALACLLGAAGLPATLKVPAHYPTIQQALDAAMNGDTVLVAPGAYMENIAFPGKAVILKSEYGPHVTVLDGNQAGSVVAFTSGVGSGTVLQGFTITNGSGTELYPLYTFGGGILCVQGASPTLLGNRIIHNSAVYGGGIYCHEASPVIASDIVAGNTVSYSGAGICLSRSFAIITNVTVSGNAGNHFGAGLYCATESDVCVTNAIFWNDSAPLGPEIAVRSTFFPSKLAIDHSDVKGGQASVHVDPNCTLDWGPAMIDQDPLFVDGAGMDFHILYESPCRDAGDPAAPGLPALDFEGDPRMAYGAVDLGADEFHIHLYYMGDATPGGQVDVKLVGLPGAAPVGLCIGAGVIEPPLPSMWGEWHLQFPIIGPIDLGAIPTVGGVMVIKGTIPGAPPPPYPVPLQALIDDALTSLLYMKVE